MSSDLVTWQPVGPASATSAAGVLERVDPISSTPARRFYRVAP
jgi:hypothetical protein